jgi:hypothetical protein
MLAAVAPAAAPVAGAALVSLVLLVTFLVALGMTLLVEKIVNAFFGVAGGALAKVPVVGGWLNSSTLSMQQRINSILGAAALRLDGMVGFFWHTLGDLVRWTMHEIRANAGLLETMARLVANPLNISAWRALWHQLVLRAKAVEAQLAHLAMHALQPLVHRVTTLERWTVPRVKALEHSAGVAIPRDIAGLRARTRTLEDTYQSAWAWLRRIDARFAAEAFAGAVAVALATLEVGWIRCSNWKRIGRGVCNTPAGDIDALIGLLAIGATVASFRELVKLGQEVEHGVAVALQDIAKL